MSEDREAFLAADSSGPPAKNVVATEERGADPLSHQAPRMRVTDLSLADNLFPTEGIIGGVGRSLFIIAVHLDNPLDIELEEVLVATPPMKRSSEIRLPSPYRARTLHSASPAGPTTSS